MSTNRNRAFSPGEIVQFNSDVFSTADGGVAVALEYALVINRLYHNRYAVRLVEGSEAVLSVPGDALDMAVDIGITET